MSLSSGLTPLNANSLRTSLNFGTASTSYRKVLPAHLLLFLLAAMATLTIWNTDLLVDRIYQCSVLLLAAWILLSDSAKLRWQFAVPLSAVALWGFCQWTLGATVDREATWLASMRFSALAATALVACGALRSPRERERFLQAMAWFGFVVAITSVIAYYTSPGLVLWSVEAPYPDVWGPFLSRNNFAQFLELTLPAALWLALRARASLLYGGMAAAMLAAGFTSASRAGAILLVFETAAVLLSTRVRQWKRTLLFVTVVALLAAIGGTHTLIGRLWDPTPLAYRDEIYRSTVDMVASRPLQGYGLGTYPWVYPRFAATDFGYRIDHAHNDWLEWAGEGGLGFMAAWTWVAVNAVFRSRPHPWAWGVAALFLHALVDFPTARMGIAAWAFILIGAIESSETRPPKFSRRTT